MSVLKTTGDVIRNVWTSWDLTTVTVIWVMKCSKTTKPVQVSKYIMGFRALNFSKNWRKSVLIIFHWVRYLDKTPWKMIKTLLATQFLLKYIIHLRLVEYHLSPLNKNYIRPLPVSNNGYRILLLFDKSDVGWICIWIPEPWSVMASRLSCTLNLSYFTLCIFSRYRCEWMYGGERRLWTTMR